MPRGSTPSQAAAALKAGALIILPTETVYGLGADANAPAAVARLFEAKGRPRFNPLIAHVADAAAAMRIGVFDDRARALAAAFWPGPLTLVVPFREGVCDLARAGLDTVALRVPAHETAQAILKAFGRPVVAPSANRSGRPSPTTFDDAMEETGFATQAAVDGGPCTVGLESTVIACLGDQPQLLRPGGLDRAEIEAVVGPLGDAETDAKRSPGRLARHYAPTAPLRLEADEPRDGEAYLGFGPGPAPWNLSPTGDLREAAANLFAHLRAADRSHPAGIAVAPIPHHGLGEAINDRLKRAAGFVG